MAYRLQTFAAACALLVPIAAAACDAPSFERMGAQPFQGGMRNFFPLKLEGRWEGRGQCGRIFMTRPAEGRIRAMVGWSASAMHGAWQAGMAEWGGQMMSASQINLQRTTGEFLNCSKSADQWTCDYGYKGQVKYQFKGAEVP